MKILPFIIMLVLATNGFSQCFTVLNTNQPSSFLTIQKGLKPAPIPLIEGASYDVLNNDSYEFDTTNNSFIAEFSNGLTVKVDTNTQFTVNSLFQEVQPSTPYAQKAKFGASNFAGSLMNGSLIVSYDGGDSNSSCVISTPMGDYELHKGLFYFKVSENKVLVFVLNGTLTSSAEKKENVVTEGFASIAVPNDIGVLEAKVSIGAEKVKKQIIDKLTADAKDVVNDSGRVLFITLNGKVVGVLLR